MVKSLYKVEDFIDVEENISGYDLNDLVHICKRVNNTKRDFLFVNRYQGKHIPEDPFKIEKLFKTFYKTIASKLDPTERIVVVGFAETATALAQFVSVYFELNPIFKNSVKYHLQTTREILDCPKLIDFNEEHSHATNQYLYCRSKYALQEGKFDRILFIEDEITTGKTILNFIEKFREMYPNCKYSVASILNWQNDENKKIFNENNIDRIYLVSGKIKDNLPKIEVENMGILDYFNTQQDKRVTRKIVDCRNKEDIKKSLGREGVSISFLDFYTYMISEELEKDLTFYIEPNDDIMVIGTEEFMYIPLSFARKIQYDFGCKVKYRATTRSPIMASREEDYIIRDGITLPSAYDENRQTYLYNMIGNYNKIIVITDGVMTDKFVNALSLFSYEYKKDIIFVKV